MDEMFMQCRDETTLVASASATSTMQAPARARRLIAIRLPDWSLWARQIIRGVHAFALQEPSWRLQVGAGGLGWSPLPSEVDGVIAAPISDLEAWHRLLTEQKTPVVSVTAALPDMLATMPGVRVDERRVAALMVQHLHACGLRRLAYNGGILRACQDARLAALRESAEAQGLCLTDYNQWLGERKRTARSLLQWIRSLPTPVGIVAWNMDAARCLASACLDARLRVPQDVAIVAWDDDAEIAESAEPTLTGMVQPAEKLGYAAAAYLAELLAGKSPSAQPVLVQPSGVLHIRQSSNLLDLPDQDVRLALQYIREHAGEPITVAAVARALQLAPRTLELNFKRVTGYTPRDAIIQARVNRAKQLLIETSWPMERIAGKSGFGRPRALFAAFAAREKLSPGQYRIRFALKSPRQTAA
jgi:LacI family transcriptional regulator